MRLLERLRSNGKLVASFYIGMQAQISSTAVVNDGNWHKAAVVVAANSFSLYLDDVLVGTVNGQINHYEQSKNQLGALYGVGWPNTSGDPWNHYSGLIDEVIIADSALPLSVIQGY